MTTADNHFQESDGHENLVARFDNLEAKVDNGLERVDANAARLEAKVDSGFERQDAKIDALEAKVDSGFERQDAKIDALEAKVDSGFERVDIRFERQDARINRMEGWVSGLRGLQYEQHCREIIGVAMSRYLRRAMIADSEAIAEQLSDAFEDGGISQQQYHSASMTDIVGQGYCRQRQTNVYIAAEASIRLNRSDVDRARERADILTSVTGNTHLPYCLSHRQWSERLQGYADEQQVTLVHHYWDGLVETSEVEPDLDE